jgi:hypothetical protein
MNPTPSSNETPEDPELLREVHKALKACGWLLPETVEEVRQAERALEEDPVEVPEELLDPFRLLEELTEQPSEPGPMLSPNPEWPPMSSGLARLVQEVGLSPAQTVSLMGYHGQMLFNRSASKSDEVTYEDWKKFYLGVKEFL